MCRKFIIPEMIKDDEIITSSVSPKVQEEVAAEALKNPFTDTFGGMCFRDQKSGKLGNAIYFVGIIDLLQQYNRPKRLENFVKSIMDDPEAISSVHPDFYSRRFNRFLSQKIV